MHCTSYFISLSIPKLIQSTCFEGFTLPRITWTIEPSPNGTNTTSIYTYPPNIGTLKTGDMNKEYCEGFELDMDAIDNTTDEIAICSSPYGYEGCFCKVPFEGSEDYCPSIESGSADMSILMFWTSFAALAVFYL